MSLAEFAVEPTNRRETQVAAEANGLTDPVPKIVAAGKFLGLNQGEYGDVPAIKANGIKLVYVKNTAGPLGNRDYYEATFVAIDPVTKVETPAPRPDCNYQIFVSPYTTTTVDALPLQFQQIQTFLCLREGFQFAVAEGVNFDDPPTRVSVPLSLQVVDFNVPEFPMV